MDARGPVEVDRKIAVAQPRMAVVDSLEPGRPKSAGQCRQRVRERCVEGLTGIHPALSRVPSCV